MNGICHRRRPWAPALRLRPNHRNPASRTWRLPDRWNRSRWGSGQRFPPPGEIRKPRRSRMPASRRRSQLIEQSPDPAEAPRGSADGPDPSVAQSPTVTPAGPPETGQPETGEKPQAAPTDEAKATPSGPTETSQRHRPRKRLSSRSAERAAYAEMDQGSPSSGELRQDVRSRWTVGKRLCRTPPPRGRGPTTPILPGDMATAHSGRRRIRIEAISRPDAICRRSGQAAGPRPGIRCRRCIRSSGCGRSPERLIR